MDLSFSEMEHIKKQFASCEHAFAMCDGSSLRNPGRSGAGAAFFKKSEFSNDGEFMFGLSLGLGLGSNNYAEYAGIILAQLFFLIGQKNPIIFSDSQLVVN